MRGGGATTHDFAARRAALDALAPVAEQVRAKLAERDRLSLEISELLGRLNAAGYCEAEGYQTTGEWVRHECRQAMGPAYDLVAVGEQLAKVGQSARAMVEGEIGFGHLALIARTSRQVKGGLFDEARLLEEARATSVGRFWYVCQQFRHAGDPEGAAGEERARHERRSLRVGADADGMVILNGLFDPAGGSLLKAALVPLAGRSGQDDDRTFEQRMADALVEAVTQNTQTHVHVSATLGTLLQAPQVAPADIVGHLVSQETLRRLTCEGSIARMLFDSESVLIDAGRERRVVSPGQRRALEARDGHCRWPGCSKKAAWCDAHHLVHWASGGATNLSNLLLLCGFHHRLIHEGNWQLLLQEDGSVQPVRPPLDFIAPPRAPSSA